MRDVRRAKWNPSGPERMKLTPKETKQVAFPRLMASNEEKTALVAYHSENL